MYTTILHTLAFFLFLSLGGCPEKNLTPPAPEEQTEPAELFTPLEAYVTVTLSDAEALDLIRKLDLSSQGLASWRELSFALDQSLIYVQGRNASSLALERPGLALTYGDLAHSLNALRSLLPCLDERPELLMERFTWLRLGPDFELTGYYEPTLSASRVKAPGFEYPLYRVPPDLRRGVPYFTREEIDRGGALQGRGLEIAWVDETDAYFLQVQGSGRLRYTDGSSSHVLYANKNNRKYVSLARLMREAGYLPEGGSNMRAIREWLLEHPDKRSELFDQNPSYVFFREAEAGPLGSMGQPLTPFVSTAVDRRVLPHGSMAILSVPLPDAEGRPNGALHALTLPQDTGGVIRGNRMDFFCGPGELAEHIAGHLDSRGAAYLLLAKMAPLGTPGKTLLP